MNIFFKTLIRGAFFGFLIGFALGFLRFVMLGVPNFYDESLLSRNLAEISFYATALALYSMGLGIASAFVRNAKKEQIMLCLLGAITSPISIWVFIISMLSQISEILLYPAFVLALLLFISLVLPMCYIAYKRRGIGAIFTYAFVAISVYIAMLLSMFLLVLASYNSMGLWVVLIAFGLLSFFFATIALGLARGLISLINKVCKKA